MPIYVADFSYASLTVAETSNVDFYQEISFFEIFSIKLRFVAVSGNARMIILEYSESLTPL